MPIATSASRMKSFRLPCATVMFVSSAQKPILGDDAEEEREGDRSQDERGLCVLGHFRTGGVSNVWYGAGVGRCVHSSESAPSHGFWGAGAPLRMHFSTM